MKARSAALLASALALAARDGLVGQFPGRRIVSIEIVNVEGHASIRLDDGTEIGWGERL